MCVRCRYTFPGPGLQAARLELQRVATVGIFVIQVCHVHLYSCAACKSAGTCHIATCAGNRRSSAANKTPCLMVCPLQGLNLRRGEAAKALTSWGATLYGMIAILLLTPLLAIPVQVCCSNPNL